MIPWLYPAEIKFTNLHPPEFSNSSETIGIQWGRHFVSRNQPNSTQNHRKCSIFYFCHCLAMKIFECQNWMLKKIKYVGNSSRWDLFKTAIVYNAKSHSRKVFRTRTSGFSGFSVLATWAALRYWYVDGWRQVGGLRVLPIEKHPAKPC